MGKLFLFITLLTSLWIHFKQLQQRNQISLSQPNSWYTAEISRFLHRHLHHSTTKPGIHHHHHCLHCCWYIFWPKFSLAFSILFLFPSFLFASRWLIVLTDIVLFKTFFLTDFPLACVLFLTYFCLLQSSFALFVAFALFLLQVQRRCCQSYGALFFNKSLYVYFLIIHWNIFSFYVMHIIIFNTYSRCRFFFV